MSETCRCKKPEWRIHRRPEGFWLRCSKCRQKAKTPLAGPHKDKLEARRALICFILDKEP